MLSRGLVASSHSGRGVNQSVWNHHTDHVEFLSLNLYQSHGPGEAALIGTIIEDPDNPVEIGRIVRAFDPCLSCGTHLIRLKQDRDKNT